MKKFMKSLVDGQAELGSDNEENDDKIKDYTDTEDDYDSELDKDLEDLIERGEVEYNEVK